MLEPVNQPPIAAPAQELCGLLDGHLLEVRGSEWTIRVFSLFATEQARWAQISLVGRPVYPLLLRIAWSADVTDILCALELWLARPVHDERVVAIAGTGQRSAVNQQLRQRQRSA